VTLREFTTCAGLEMEGHTVYSWSQKVTQLLSRYVFTSVVLFLLYHHK
jgi:hypothetical protein